MNATAEILAHLQSHYPCEALPFGTLTKVGTMFGVTRQRVQQIAVANGFVGYNSQMPEVRVVPGRMGRLLCPDCGNEMPNRDQHIAQDRVSKKRCDSCRWTLVSCSDCGKPVRRLTSSLISRIDEATTRNAAGRPVYTGRAFCDRACFGRYIGKRKRKVTE